MKVAVVGGGSTYTPELVSGLARERERLPIQELVLQDIDPERREIVGGLAGRMLERSGFEGKLAVTADLDRAVDSADFVLIQIRVGGQEARLSDETVPLACGCIGQETTGAGGFAKAMRTVPVVLEIAERVRELAADGAWIIDFTNPVGIVTRALLDEHGDALAAQNELSKQLVDELGVLPSYYLHYFYEHDAVLAQQVEGKPRAETVMEIERGLLELYRDPTLDEKPALLEQRGGAFYSEAATGLAASLASGSGETHVIDLRNNGTLGGLADDDVVEVPAQVERSGPVPLQQRPLAPELLGLTQHVAAYERLTAEAAVTRDLETARKALLSHPLIGQWSLGAELLERLVDTGHLPSLARTPERTA